MAKKRVHSNKTSSSYKSKGVVFIQKGKFQKAFRVLSVSIINVFLYMLSAIFTEFKAAWA